MSISTTPAADVARELRAIIGAAIDRPADLSRFSIGISAWLDRAAVLLEEQAAAPRAAVVVNMTGGVLQGASATVPLDVYCFDYESSCSDDTTESFIVLDGDEVELSQVGAMLDPGLVERVSVAPTVAQHRAALDEAAPDLNMGQACDLLASGLVIGLGGKVAGIDDDEALANRFHVKLDSGQVVAVTVTPADAAAMIAS